MNGRLFLAVGFLTASASFAAEQLSVAQLLERYDANQRRLQSYIIKSEMSQEAESSIEKGVRKSYESNEVRTDGNRFNLRITSWGNATGIDKWIPPESPNYLRYLWDGQSAQSYTRDAVSPGIVMVDQHNVASTIEGMMSGADPTSGVRGFFTGSKDRIDKVLSSPGVRATVTYQAATKDQGASYVIHATLAGGGKCTLWMDPEHGYCISKAKLRWEKGDAYWDEHLQGGYVSATLDNVRFEEVDGVWIPVEADTVFDQDWGNGTFSKGLRHYKQLDMKLNPDHEGLQSFIPDDVREGATVIYESDTNIKYIWHNGEIVPKFDQNALDTIKQEVNAASTKPSATKPAVAEAKTQGPPRAERVVKPEPQTVEELRPTAVGQAAPSKAGSSNQQSLVLLIVCGLVLLGGAAVLYVRISRWARG